jgi:hypothetical protein
LHTISGSRSSIEGQPARADGRIELQVLISIETSSARCLDALNQGRAVRGVP